MVVEQRSNWDGQSHTRVQVPGFAPQQVKHFSPEAANRTWNTVTGQQIDSEASTTLMVCGCSYLLAAAHR